MDSVKIKLTLLIDLYGALFKWSNVGKQLFKVTPVDKCDKSCPYSYMVYMFLPFSCLKVGSLCIYFAFSYGVMWKPMLFTVLKLTE